MYLDYFSLKRHPFRITPDPSLFFPGGIHGRGVVLDALVYGITSGEGILKVVGEVGSGKTMLCRMLEERLPDAIKIVYLANPSLSARDIVYAIAIELGLDVDAATDRLLVMHKLQEYLLHKHSEGGSVVVFIEEAQSMPLETLEEVRLLSNLETHRHKLMQIVLFGQPELEKKLDQKSIRQLKERITHSFNLKPLNLDEIREYLHFRLQSAGCPWPQLFSPKAEQLLSKASTGLTRRINILADKSLLAAYADPAIQPNARSGSGEILPMVLPRHVKIAITDSGYKNINASLWGHWLGYGGAALGGAFVVGMALWLLGFEPSQDVGQIAQSVPQAQQEFVATTTSPVSPTTESSSTSTPRTDVTRSEPVTRQQVTIEPELESVLVDTANEVAVTSVQTVQAGQVLRVTEPEIERTPEPVPESVPVVLNEPVAQVFESPEPELSSAPVIEETEVPVVEAVDVSQVEQVRTPAVSSTRAPISEPLAQEPQAWEGFTGLTRGRLLASERWLDTIEGQQGYSVQLFSVKTQNTYLLEEFLEFLTLTNLLEDSYICLISGNTRRDEQWLILHGQYGGLSGARDFIDELPTYISQHGPYARNLKGIGCANERLK